MEKDKKTKKNNKKAPVKESSPFIKGLRVTEKATMLAGANVYTFNIATNANKVQIAKAIETLYKVKPTKVNIAQISEKNVVVKGRKGVKQGGKKAIVYLKKGDKIEFV